MTKVLIPQRRMAILVTNKESTHAKSQNHPESTLPIVLDIPEMVPIIHESLIVYLGMVYIAYRKLK